MVNGVLGVNKFEFLVTVEKNGYAGFFGFCFILAAVAGLSSATLLIPRLSNWPAGSTHIWVNATSHDLWPDL